MAITLFEHNARAYDAAVAMLAETGKACVIHPTGTGKSFIGFKLCEDNASARVCWLSPSEYIFKTQQENLAATGTEMPENICFFTYAKLMLLDEAQLAEIRPDYIILDEFHRCGAEQWGAGVQRLLTAYPDAPILGLSATNIRYLDNQRDMADELFDGNVASEMTLGEAIVRGILNAPTYVLSVYAYRKDYDRLKNRVRRAKNRAVRDEADRYLEALRRALEHADGLDAIFDKHMTDRTGKYLVFCANVEHMREMIDHVPEWFGRIDAAPHIYSAYSDDPATSRAFAEFKADTSEHLKLLFCIDMLNEGIHVEDVSGVILFRPTVSPIIYKQQIGRALSASKTKKPVIFDVVNNIENLYSIESIEEEMREAVSHYRFLGEGGVIVNERFRIIDEVGDARQLFEKLNDTLTASWELMYGFAKAYYEEHGNLEVPRRYKTEDGYSLGSWIVTQRMVRAGTSGGILDERRIALLDSIGMIWENARELSWKQWYEALCRYKERYDDIDVKSRYVDETGAALGAFLSNIRTARRDGRRNAFLTDEHIRQLDELGMIWERFDYAWEQNYQACARYYAEHGNLNVPNNFVQDGYRIGPWIRRQRMLRDGRVEGVITPERIERLDDIGMVWTDAYTSRWEYGYEQAKKWYEEHGNLNVPTMYVNDKGFPLGIWLKRHIPNEAGKTQIKITPEKREKLDALGMVWERPEDSWEVRYALVKAYYDEHGNLNIPPQYKADGIWIAKWLNEQRQVYIGHRAGKTLTEDQISRLESIGMTWENRTHAAIERAWQEQYEEAKRYFQAHGDLKIPGDYRTTDGKNLRVWVLRQRSARKAGKLSQEKAELLTAIGMEWEFDDPWEVGYTHASQYYRENGNLDAESGYVCEDGYRLGGWLANQRANHNNPTEYHRLSEEQTKRLEAIGIVWKPSEARWMEGCRHAAAYLRLLNGKTWKTNYVSPDGHKTGEWMHGQLRVLRRGGMSAEHMESLREIGLIHENRATMNSLPLNRVQSGGVRYDLQVESGG